MLCLCQFKFLFWLVNICYFRRTSYKDGFNEYFNQASPVEQAEEWGQRSGFQDSRGKQQREKVITKWCKYFDTTFCACVVLAPSFVYVLLVVNRYMMLHGYNFLTHMKLLNPCCIFSTSVGPKDIFFLESLVIGMNIATFKLPIFNIFPYPSSAPIYCSMLMLLNSR